MILAPVLLAGCLSVDASHDRITAGDLAAAEPGFAALAPDTALAYAPVPGVRRMLGAAELKRLAGRNGITIEPAGGLCVERSMRQLGRDELLAAIRRSLGDASATIELLDWNRYPAPDGEIEFPRTALRAPGRAGDATIWKGWVVYAAKRRFAIWARVRLTVNCAQVVATEELRAGVPIQAGQLRTEARAVFPERNPAPLSIKDAAGRIPRRSIPAGSPVSPGLLRQPADVARGDAVKVEVRNGNARLELEGRAEASGNKGQTITVRNPHSGKSFRARVETQGKVVVQ